MNKSEERFDKKRLLEKFDQLYQDNAGSSLLAKGVIEHVFCMIAKP